MAKNEAARTFETLKVMLPPGALVLQLTRESFWRLIGEMEKEERLVFKCEDSTFFFDGCDVVYFFAEGKGNPNFLPKKGRKNG